METLNPTPSMSQPNSRADTTTPYFLHRLTRFKGGSPLKLAVFADQVDEGLSRCKSMLSLLMTHIFDKQADVSNATLYWALDLVVCEIQDVNALVIALHDAVGDNLAWFVVDADLAIDPKKAGRLMPDFSHRLAGYNDFLTDTDEYINLIKAMLMRCIGGLELLKSHCDGNDRIFDQDTLYYAADLVLKGIEDIQAVIDALYIRTKQQA